MQGELKMNPFRSVPTFLGENYLAIVWDHLCNGAVKTPKKLVEQLVEHRPDMTSQAQGFALRVFSKILKIHLSCEVERFVKTNTSDYVLDACDATACCF